MQKVSHLFLQEIGYKKANGSQLLNRLILAKQIELCNKATKEDDGNSITELNIKLLMAMLIDQKLEYNKLYS